jgi:hypothetical protein
MTQDEIIEMAKQAGLHIATDVKWMPIIGLEYAEKFAKLVREDALAQPAPVQKPVSWQDTRKTWVDVPLKNVLTEKPQRKPLTDEEILTYRYMIDWTAEWSYINFARAIEAAHGIKG